METELKAVPEIVYTDPFTERTPRKSQAWFNVRAAYLSFKVEIQIVNAEVSLEQIERNSNDGGKWRWDTPLFDQEVDDLIASIRSTGKFEAVWLRKDKDSSTYSVLDGHHRVVAWKKLGNSTVPAVVVNVTPVEVVEFK
jgi:hypothetical protein